MENKKTIKERERDRSPKKNKYAIDMRAEKQSDLSRYTKQTLTGWTIMRKWSTKNNGQKGRIRKETNKNLNSVESDRVTLTDKKTQITWEELIEPSEMVES